MRGIRRSLAAAVAAALSLILTLAACGQPEDTSAGASATPADTPTAESTPADTPAAQSPTPAQGGTTAQPVEPNPSATAVPGELADSVGENFSGGLPVTEAEDYTDPVAYADGLAAEVIQLEAVEGEARGGAEVAGPAVRFTIELTNDTAEPVDLTFANVTASTISGAAGQLQHPGGQMFEGVLPAGGTAEGVYLFTVPAEERDDVLLLVTLDSEHPVAAFEGEVPAP